MPTEVPPVLTGLPKKASNALRYWSIGLVLLSVVGILWILNQGEIVKALTGRGELPAEWRWLYDTLTGVTLFAVVAAFVVNVASFTRRHRKAVDIVFLVIATLLFLAVALFVLGEVFSPH